MQTISIKEKAKPLVESLPENSTWDDLLYEIYVRQTIEVGLTQSKNGQTMSVKEVRAQFGLPR